MMASPQENRRKRTAWVISITLHGLLLLAFIFMIAWRAPNPPHPEYGIEVNFGTDSKGSGDIQPTQPVNTSETETTEESDPAPASEEVTNDQPVEEPSEPAPEAQIEDTPTPAITQDAPSPDVVEEKPDAQKPKEEVKEVEEKPARTPVLYENKGSNTADGTGDDNTEAQKANHGDDSESGDKGQKDGTLDSRTLYGNQGGGDGAPGLRMSGWTWDFIPDVKDNSAENGRIVFEIKVDDQGEITSVRKIEGSVSAAVERLYRQEVQRLTFTKTSDNHSPAPESTGIITFIIKSK